MFYKTLVMQSQLDNPISPLDTCTSSLVWSVSSSDHTLRYKKKKKMATVPYISYDMATSSWLPSLTIDTTRREWGQRAEDMFL